MSEEETNYGSDAASEESNPPGHGDWQTQLVHTLTGMQALLESTNVGKRKENNWLTMKRAMIGTVVFGSLLVYVLFYSKMLGFQTDPVSNSLAVINIEGEISPGREASAERVVPLIMRACQARHVKALVLQINSGGGSPSESERIMAALDECKAPTNDTKPKKVYAVINGIGASAAYMIAMRADEIIAGRYSMVGSIGAIIRYPDLSELANRYGVHEKVFRSAPLKGGPSYISGSTPEDDKAFQEMVSKMGRTFLEEVKVARMGKLKIADKELFSGRVWTAAEAKANGLIDRVAVMEDLKQDIFKDMDFHEYKQKSSFVEGMGFKQMISSMVADALRPQLQ